jgi:hypothetical protein
VSTPAKTSHLMRYLALLVVVVVVVGVVGYYAYENSFQPNIQATDIQPGTPTTYPQTTIAQSESLVSVSGSFSYTATANGAAYLVFDNSFSFISSKSVTVSYTIAGQGSSSQSFNVPAGSAYTLQIPLNEGQSVSGTFSVSGGSGNDVNFEIEQYTCSQSVPFSLVLVNSGNSNGYATLVLQTESGVQVFTNVYYVMAGQQLPVSGSAAIADCATHTLSPTISVQKA